MEIMTWTWPQVLTQSVPDQTLCELLLYLEVSKDGGAYELANVASPVWLFDNSNFSLKKGVTTVADTSQIGVYTFKY